MARTFFGWALVLVPAGGMAAGILTSTFQLLFDPRAHVAAEVSTVVMVLAFVGVAALVPMGLGAALIASAGGISPMTRKVAGWGLITGPALHLVVLIVSGLQYYNDPPWSVPGDELVTSFLPAVGLSTLAAAIPIGVGIALLRKVELLGRPQPPPVPPPAPSEPSRDDELLST